MGAVPGKATRATKETRRETRRVVVDITKRKVVGGTSVIKRAASQEHGANLLHMVWKENTTLREHVDTWAVTHREDKETRLDGVCPMQDTNLDQRQVTRLEEVADTAVEAAAAVVVDMEKEDKAVVMHLHTVVKWTERKQMQHASHQLKTKPERTGS